MSATAPEALQDGLRIVVHGEGRVTEGLAHVVAVPEALVPSRHSATEA